MSLPREFLKLFALKAPDVPSEEDCGEKKQRRHKKERVLSTYASAPVGYGAVANSMHLQRQRFPVHTSFSPSPLVPAHIMQPFPFRSPFLSPPLYLPEWKVLLCTDCGTCIPPGKTLVHTYLYSKHGEIESAHCTTLVNAIESAHLDLLEPTKVPLPSDGGPPVAYLNWDDGWVCTKPDCTGEKRITCSHNVALQHRRQAHPDLLALARANRVPLEPGDFGPGIRKVVLQTFFEKQGWRRYFVVRAPQAQGPTKHSSTLRRVTSAPLLAASGAPL